MSNFIFTFEKVTKNNLYTRMKQIMTTAGWQNISSKPSIDYDVMYSTGEAGDKKMVVQMKEFDSTSTTAAISNSTDRRMDLRLPVSYEPGVAGTAGVFGRPGTGWRQHLVLHTEAAKESELYIYYHCNKNRLVLVIECPPSHVPYNANKSTILFMGSSDRTVGLEYESSAPIIATTLGESGAVYATDNPADIKTNSYNLSIYKELAPKSVSLNGTIFMTDIAYGSTTEGIRGYIDGIYDLKDNPAIVGDILKDTNGYEYRIFKAADIHSNWYSFLDANSSFAIRVK